MKKLFALLAAGLMVSAFIFGCGTEEPWNPTTQAQLNLVIISSPDSTTEMMAPASASFFWTSTGASGSVEYTWYLSPLESGYNDASDLTDATYENLGSASSNIPYTFYVKAEDAAGHIDSASVDFTVMQTVADVDTPTVVINTAPAEDSYIATGSNLAFDWTGDDGNGNNDLLVYQYAYPTLADSSAWITATNVTFTNVAAANPADFSVRAQDEAGNVSAWATVSFIVRDATILYVDDYQFLDQWGDVDAAKEREQKQFYRDALEGYAFAEWDIAVQGMVDSATVLNYSTIIFGSDAAPGTGDGSGTWWYDIGAEDGGSIRYFMDNGGHLLACGNNILVWIYNNNPPLPGDFEYDWFGIDSTLGWDYWDDFTWAVNAGNFTTLPDSMKIDVAKNGDQVDYAENIFAFQDSVVILYTKGLDIDGVEPYDYGESVGHIFYPGGGEARAAMINFDAFSMPLMAIRETFQTVLTEFGE
jgi:hypothetical protein